MENLLRYSAVLVLLSGCASSVPEALPIQDEPMETPVVEVEKVMPVSDEVQDVTVPVYSVAPKHYSDDLLSFDYPGDLFVLRQTQGEGSYSESLSFMEWNANSEVYEFAGSRIDLKSYPEDEMSVADQFLADQKYEDGTPLENLREIKLSSAQAFEWVSPGGFCGSYTGLEFLFSVPSQNYNADATTTDFYGRFGPIFCDTGLRGQEILDLFESSVQF